SSFACAIAGSGKPNNMTNSINTSRNSLRIGMAGLGMIFDETYRPLLEKLHSHGLYRRDFGYVDVELAAVASRTGARAERLRQPGGSRPPSLAGFGERNAVKKMLAHGVAAVCVPTRDDRHYPAARAALVAGKHVLIEKPSVLSLRELDQLQQL